MKVINKTPEGSFLVEASEDEVHQLLRDPNYPTARLDKMVSILSNLEHSLTKAQITVSDVQTKRF